MAVALVPFNGTAEDTIYTQPQDALQTQRETGVQAGDARPKGCEISIAPRNSQEREREREREAVSSEFGVV